MASGGIRRLHLDHCPLVEVPLRDEADLAAKR
jgi:hypothetical protein